MSDRGSNFLDRRYRRRRYLSGSEDDRKRKDRPERRRSFDRSQSADKNGARVRDDSRSDYRRRHRSRSPRRDRGREKGDQLSRSRSPTRRPRSSRDDRRPSKRDYSASRSPPPKRRRHDSRDSRRHSSYHDDRREPSLSRRHSPIPPPASRRNYQDDRRKASPPRHRSRTPPPPSKRSNAPLPSQQAAFNRDPTSNGAVIKPPEEVEKQKPNYAPTGKLAAETNTVANTSIVLKYNEPPEARLPSSSAAWRLYVFKGSDLLETLPLHERSCWLFGRERAVVDFPTEHPSCSKQHAVLQFRYTEKKDEWGEKKGGVKPYVIDLDSANGTRVNSEKVPERRYVEIRSGDVVTFGESTREYVLMLPPKDPPKG